MLPLILGLVGGGLLVSAFTEDKKYAKGGSIPNNGLEQLKKIKDEYSKLYPKLTWELKSEEKTNYSPSADVIYFEGDKFDPKIFIKVENYAGYRDDIASKFGQYKLHIYLHPILKIYGEDTADENPTISKSFDHYPTVSEIKKELQNKKSSWFDKMADGGMMSKGGEVKVGDIYYDIRSNAKNVMDKQKVEIIKVEKDNIYFKIKNSVYDISPYSFKQNIDNRIWIKDGGMMAKGGSVSSEVEQLWRGYAEAVLFTEEEELGSDYTIYDFDKKTETSTKKMLANYYKKNKKAIEESGLELDIIGNDIWYTRSGQGAGFFDHSLDDEIEKKLTDGAKSMGEFPMVETYNGKVSVTGGKVFDKKS